MVSNAGRREYRIVVIDRASSILRCLYGQQRTAGVISKSTGLDEATTIRYLSSLASHGLVERDGATGQYSLGLELFHLGQAALAERDILTVARPVMTILRDQVGETVNLAARNGSALMIIESLESRRAIRMGARVGDFDTWHASGLGKALLSSLEDAGVKDLLEQSGGVPLVPYTSRTIADLGVLFEELARVRERGYAVDNGESEEELRCVAAVITPYTGAANYALSVSGPSSRIAQRAIPEIAKLVKAAARRISTDLTGQGSQPKNHRRKTSPAERDFRDSPWRT